MIYTPLINHRIDTVKFCKNRKCRKSLKNKKYYRPIVREFNVRAKTPVIEEGKDFYYKQAWLAIDKQCKRCGYITIAI